MENRNSDKCMNGTTVAGRTRTAGASNCSAVRARRSSSQPRRDPLCSCGENSSTHQGNRESIARYSGMNRIFLPRTLSEKLTPSLISSGLVKGTTRLYGERLSNRGIPAGVSYAPDGSVEIWLYQGRSAYSGTFVAMELNMFEITGWLAFLIMSMTVGALFRYLKTEHESLFEHI